jgi:LysR family carnitine catabolism transcriptional activator
MDLRQLEYIVAVADTGSFTQAAASLRVAQPSLSQSIRKLEVELGVELFHRTTRSVRLSAAGVAMLPPARQALRDADNARAAVAAVVGLEAGHLDIVCLPTLAAHPTSALIGAFRQAHPKVRVRVTEPEELVRVAQRVRDGSSEIGVTELPIDLAGLTAHVLERQEFVALVPRALANHLGSSRITIARLADQPLVTTPTGTSTRRQLDDALEAAGLESQVAVETDYREAIPALVRAGAGVAVLPRPLAEAAASGEVAVLRISPTIRRDVGIIHRATALAPAAAAFVTTALDLPLRPTRPRPRRR